MRLHFHNGALFDGHRHHDHADLWVEDGVIVAAPGGPADERIDLAGGLVAPGFIDAHAHPVQGGLERLRCDLSGGSTRDDYRAAVKAYADAHPDAEWILGGGWAMSAFPGGTPSRADLDDLVPDRPVYLPNRDHHGAWVNSRALELAGVDTSTPDPPDGRFERAADGTPTGTLHEGAMAAVARLVPAETDDDLYAGLLEGQQYLHSCGVTGWQDAIIGKYAGHGDPATAYTRAVAEGTLTAEVVGALWWRRRAGVEQVEELIAQRAAISSARFRATSVKIMQDGVAENYTAAMNAPYLDRCGHPTDNRGHSFVEAGALREAVTALAAADFQVHVHAIGDRGVREALDAFEAAARPDLLPHIAHLQVVDPVDVPRFADLGVTANMQMLWACLEDQMAELTIPFLGPERSAWQYPFGALHRSGAPLCAGSDWPVSTPDPLQAIHTAVTRLSYEEATPEPFLPEQALPLEVAFAAYTSGSARINRSRAGTTNPGRPADLVVLDRDPFAAPIEEIGATRVVSTWIGGRPV
ncbi:MAG: amidohydrolase [Nocardioides sp.]|jgi:predicted amidohydrolase YtcJ